MQGNAFLTSAANNGVAFLIITNSTVALVAVITNHSAY